MQSHIRIIAVARLCLSHIGIYHAGILTMHHYRHCGITEYLAQRVVAVNEHIACTCPHKQFHTRHDMAVERLQCICIAVGSPEEETVVHMAFLPRNSELGVESINRCRLRHSVGHIKKRRDPSVCRSLAFRTNVCLCSKTRFAEMHMAVYHPGQDKKPCGIYLPIIVATGNFLTFYYLGNNIVLHHQRAVMAPVFVNDYAAIYQCFHYLSAGLASSLGVGAASGAGVSDTAASASGASFIPFIIAWFS